MTLLQTPAEARSSRVLGRAVHPGAIRRLHELYPEARVFVKHTIYRVPLPPNTPIRMDGPRDCEQHATRVWIDLKGDWTPNSAAPRPSHSIFADAVCHPEDNFERRKGVEIAFRRALDIARNRYASDRQTAAYKEQGTLA